jgi:hypothetical protein
MPTPRLVTRLTWVIEGFDDKDTCIQLAGRLRSLRGLARACLNPDPTRPNHAIIEMDVQGSDEPPGVAQAIRELGGRIVERRREQAPGSSQPTEVFPEQRPLGTKNF